MKKLPDVSVFSPVKLVIRLNKSLGVYYVIKKTEMNFHLIPIKNNHIHLDIKTLNLLKILFEI